MRLFRQKTAIHANRAQRAHYGAAAASQRQQWTQDAHTKYEDKVLQILGRINEGDCSDDFFPIDGERFRTILRPLLSEVAVFGSNESVACATEVLNAIVLAGNKNDVPSFDAARRALDQYVAVVRHDLGFTM
jgi:hypothetical protein